MNFSTIDINIPDFTIERGSICHYRNEESFRVNVFILKANKDVINENWKRFSNMVAVNYQNLSYMTGSEFDRWNFYIIYVSEDSISKELKNKIENDKFSSRKIVEDLYDKELNDYEVNCLIVKHITNADLKEIVDTTQEIQVSEYTPLNEKLWELLVKEEKIIGDRKAQENFLKKINEI